jgi:hypothetical protein
VYRKQVLAKRRINYPMSDGTKRVVEFDDAYLTDLADSFKAGAYDLVPFQLATPQNQHNEDPRNYGGRVLGVEQTADGLDVILELSEDAAELVERTGRKLGVSARIKESLERVDGRTFKRAIRHVLGTLDPRMVDLRPWEPVDLSNDDPTDLIDLTGYTYQGGNTMPRYIDLSTLSDEQAEALESFAALTNIDLSETTPEQQPEGPDDTPDEGDKGDDQGDDTPDEDTPEEDAADDKGDDTPEDGLTDEELEALIDAELSSVELSNLDGPDDGPDPIDLAAGLLANAGMDDSPEAPATPNRLFQLTAHQYAAKGVPPALLDLAEPILSLEPDDDALDLATPTGESVNVRGIVTAMLDAVAGTIDLSGEAGYGHETEPDERVKTQAAAWTEYLENN